ncbi:hypothetical protein QTN47_08075 [Danxiaibacter flavus]|uniref:Uncharacterized protein n=1 Tax=Danxiaibacter flavus TaxID=3049108 RepID=A0ABV3ZC44_9BACT|nr:hypothetical protein QNM32_08075 [Chitinophagaceae bacterium DXS]
MKLVVSIILTALLGYAVCLFLPWWGFAVSSFLIGIIIHQKPSKAFAAGFAGLFLLWGFHAYFIDLNNQNLLAPKIADVLGIGSSGALIIITAIVGGLVSAFAALSGSFGRTLIKTQN